MSGIEDLLLGFADFIPFVRLIEMEPKGLLTFGSPDKTRFA